MEIQQKIPYFKIESTLKSISNNVPVRIRRWKSDLLTVYITKCTSNTIWARNSAENQDVRIFPTIHIEILKIGHQEVQSKEDFKSEMKEIEEAERLLRKEERKKLYREAYIHNLRYPNVD